MVTFVVKKDEEEVKLEANGDGAPRGAVSGAGRGWSYLGNNKK
jgi:hypothetical protein